MHRPRPRGWWYPWIFVGGMALVVAVNAVLVAKAIGTFPGLETADHYRKGLAYNANLAAASLQAERGWTMDLAFQPMTAAREHGGSIEIRFRDRFGAPLDRLEVSATLIRPTHAGFDQTLPLAHVGEGRYRGTVEIPLPGQWDVRILAHQQDDHFQATRRLVIP